jgi:hypothetical protein
LENQKLAPLFGNNSNISIDERARVLVEINKIGSLTFDITSTRDGWVAQCKEVAGIITGGTNPNPTASEIETQIRDAIYAAFDVKSTADRTSPYFTYNNLNINRSSRVHNS